MSIVINSSLNEDAFNYFLIHVVNYLKQFERQTLYKDATEKLHDKEGLKDLIILKEPEEYVKKGLEMVETHLLPLNCGNLTVGEVLDKIST